MQCCANTFYCVHLGGTKAPPPWFEFWKFEVSRLTPNALSDLRSFYKLCSNNFEINILVSMAIYLHENVSCHNSTAMCWVAVKSFKFSDQKEEKGNTGSNAIVKQHLWDYIFQKIEVPVFKKDTIFNNAMWCVSNWTLIWFQIGLICI